MKSFLAFLCLLTFTVTACGQQDKSKRPSPPATAKETIASGATLTINYSQPAVKGRTIGKDLEPMAGKVWRTGANEATVFETDKAITVQGKSLPAGKYGLFTLVGDDGQWTVIFNKTWDQWGAFNYKDADDVLRVPAEVTKAPSFAERFTINIDKSGKVTMLWGDSAVSFMVQ